MKARRPLRPGPPPAKVQFVDVIPQASVNKAIGDCFANRPEGIALFEILAFKDDVIGFREWARARYGAGWELRHRPADLYPIRQAEIEAARPPDDDDDEVEVPE